MQIDYNSAQAALNDALGSARVELRLAARGLPKMDTLRRARRRHILMHRSPLHLSTPLPPLAHARSKSDPYAVVYNTAATGQTKWREAGRTEITHNNHAPDWCRPVLSAYNPAKPLPMRVVVYDGDVTTSKYIGELRPR